MYFQNLFSRLYGRLWEFDFPVNSTWPQKRWIQNINSISTHDNLNILATLEAIQLIQQFQHSPLHLAVPTPIPLEPTPADTVDLVHENNAGRVLFGHQE